MPPSNANKHSPLFTHTHITLLHLLFSLSLFFLHSFPLFFSPSLHNSTKYLSSTMETPHEFYQASAAGYYNNVQQFAPEKRNSDIKPGGHFVIEDLLDFPSDDLLVTDAAFDNVTGTSTDSSALTVVDSCNSSFSGNEARFGGNLADHAQFSNELCVPVIFNLLVVF